MIAEKFVVGVSDPATQVSDRTQVPEAKAMLQGSLRIELQCTLKTALTRVRSQKTKARHS